MTNCLILLACSNSVMEVGRLAAAWNIPIFTYAGTSEALENKTEFRTLTRLTLGLGQIATFYIDVFKVSLVLQCHLP